MLDIPIRSGIINAVLEVLLVLLVCPIWCSGITKIVNKSTFHSARKGHGVPVGQGIPSLFNPVQLFKSRAAGSKLLLVGEITMSAIIFWLELGVNGKNEVVYNTETRFVLNGGAFPDVVPKSEVERLRKIEGLSSQSRSCFRQVRPKTYELYGVSYERPQNFERDISRVFGFNESMCLDPQNVAPSVGIRFVADYDSIIREYDFNTQRFKKGRLPGSVDEGYLEETCEASLYGTNSFTVLGPYSEGSRLMVTVSKEKEDQFVLEVGGLVNLEDNDTNAYPIYDDDYGDSTCTDLNYTRMTRREFSVNITTMNTVLDTRGFARSVTAYLVSSRLGSSVYRPFNAIDLIAELFFSGDVESDEDTEQEIGQFQRMQVRVRQGERSVTEVSRESLIMGAVVLAAVLVGLGLNMLVDNQGRDITSVAWTQGVVRSHYEDLGRCWNKTPDICTYWVQIRDGWTAHFGPKGYGDIVRAGDGIRNEDISGRKARGKGEGSSLK